MKNTCFLTFILFFSIKLQAAVISFSNIPVVDQGSFQICNAITVQQATDYYLHSQNIKSSNYLSSTLMIAVEYKDTPIRRILGLETSLDGGKICKTFKKSIYKHGSCPAEVIDNNFNNYSGQSTLKFDSFKSAFRDLGRIYTKFQQNKKQSNHIQSDHISIIQTFLMTLKFPQSISEHQIANALLSRNRVTFLRNLLSPYCKSQRTFVKKTRCKKKIIYFKNKTGRKRYIKKIKHKLSSQPVMISYCSNFLFEGKQFNKKPCGYHASLIIGHRLVNQQDEFLIRNSWGNDCSKYHSDWQCTDGNIWVDADTLIKNTTDYNFLKTK